MNLYTIRLDSKALNVLGGTIGSRQSSRLKNIVESLAIDAIRAFQSKVPIDTGELRNQKINMNIEGKGELTTAKIFVEDSPHFGRKKKPISATLLAQLLQKNKYKRSKTSEAIPPFSSIGKGSPTANWIDSGRLAFLNVYRRTLRQMSKK